jgi:Fungal specific transcription factor domain
MAMDHPHAPPGSMVPAKAVSDRLVQAYLRTFQAVLTIVHVPTFLREYSDYWKSPGTSNQPFTVMLLLVLSIGSRFCSKEPGLSRVLTLQWIKTASDWLLSSKQRSRLCLDGLRIQCLLLLARKVNAVTYGSAWLCTGNLYRAATYAGLHVRVEDNGDGPRNRWETEARRRLWVTIVELDLQASMDCGSMPTVSVEESNYPLPSNIEDVSLGISEGALRDAAVPQSKPLDLFTQSSLQILLAKTLPVRLKIARFLNNQGLQYSFETALGLSAQLLGEFKKCHDLIERYRMASKPPTSFPTRLFDLLMRRFILSLHHPFALKAMSEPQYCYSRQICIDTSISLLTHLSQSNDADFRHLQLKGTGLFCDVYAQSALYLTGEITNQIDTDQYFLSTSQRFDLARREMRDIIDKYSQLAADRIAAGETNIKRHVLVSCLLAQADAKYEAASVQRSVSITLEKTLEKCGSLLQAQLQVLTDARSMDCIAHRNTNQLDWPQWDEFLGLHPPNRPSSQIFGSLGYA